MSFKAKDLHYEKQEPAFLRRMKGAYDANDGRSNIQTARPKKSRLKTGDGEEDEPLILNEKGEVVGKKEFDGMVKGHDEGEKRGGDGEVSNDTSTAETEAEKTREQKQQIAGIGGGGRKRKQIRTVGGGSEDEAESKTKEVKSMKPANKSSANLSAREEGLTSTTKKPTDNPKKKTKKIKLSFDEPE